MRRKVVVSYLALMTLAQLCTYVAWVSGAWDPLFYFDPRIGLWVLESFITGQERAGPGVLSWLSLAWLGCATFIVTRSHGALRVYQAAEVILALPSFLFFVMVVVMNMSPAHGFSVRELAIPVPVFVAFSLSPLAMSMRAGRKRETVRA